jgi:hypothetical protein
MFAHHKRITVLCTGAAFIEWLGLVRNCETGR